jgi:vinculin
VAALSLKKETMRYSSKQNPIVKTAADMAENMAKMARLAASTSARSDADLKGHKSDMIATAKAIAERAKDIQKYAKAVAESCSDKRLKSDLLFLCDRLPTIATQLKIIASVKAASGNTDDPEADSMLVKNANNLMETVQRTVRACEAASLKSFKQSANVAMSAIKWRRKARTSVRK